MNDGDMAAPRTLAFVSRKWPPAMGGMETYSRALSEALEAHIDVRRLVLPGHSDGSVPGPGKLLWFGLRAAVRLLFSPAPADVTHVADMASWPLALCAFLRRPQSRIVLSAHGTDVAYPARAGLKARLYGIYLRTGARLLRRATVVANSSATAHSAKALGFEKTAVVPLAAKVAMPPMRSPSDTILFCGRLIPQKGCAWFIREVLPLLPSKHDLAVAGKIWDEREGAALKDPRVRYLGVLGQPDLAQAQADALCMVVPNINLANGEFEGFGLVATEAAAAGAVVLAARHGGLSEAVVDGRTGFLLPPGDAGAWAAKVIEIAGWSEAKRSKFTEPAKAYCAEYFSWERVACATFALYCQGLTTGQDG